MPTTMTATTRRRIGLATAAVVIAGAGVAGGVAVAHAASPTSTTPTSTSTASPTPSGTATTSSGKVKAKGKGLRAEAIAQLKGLQHATWVVEGKDGKFVTHDAISGAVTAISPTSVTVKAKDGVSQTYVVTSGTKISLAQGKGTKPTVGATTDVATGTDVVVTGTASGSTLTAERVVVPKG